MPTRPFLDAWLRRTRKQLSVSGRLSEVALLLSQREGQSPSDWSVKLRSILDGDAIPSLDLVTSIDTLLAKPGQPVSLSPDPTLF